MGSLLLTSALFLVFGIFYFLSRKKKGKKYPPRPGYGLPIVGHIFKLGKRPYKTLMDWKPVYGPMVSLDFGSFPTVAISDYKLIKDAMADWRFSGRPNLPPFSDRSGRGEGRHGILLSDGQEWLEVRRFTIRHLRDFGFGKKSMQTVFHEEASGLVDRLQKLEGRPVVLRTQLNTAVLNSLWHMIASERFEHDHPQLNKLLNCLSSEMSENSLTGISIFIPWITKYFPNVSGYNKLRGGVPYYLDFLRHQLNAHRESITFGKPRDLMDTYLEEINNCKDPKSFFYGDLGEQVVILACLDLFIAGAETTSTGMAWFGLYLAAYPEIQEKLHQEILGVVGKSRLPSLDDRARMPYYEAVMQEVLRMSSFVYLSIFHSTLADAELGGYTIPKDTMIIPNLYSCNHDVEYWGDPEVFRPERFLSADGQTVIRQEVTIPFSTGKRTCPGENLARAELFTFSTTICQRFQFGFDPNNLPASLEPDVNMVLNPKSHKLIFTQRSN